MLGAGVMGAQIAAHLINAQVPVLLFDLPAKEGPKNGIALKAIENLKKLLPAPFGVKDDAQYIQPANYDDIEKLKECDLVIEAIAERMDWKHDLYKKVSPHIGAKAIFATNTSGLSITELSKGFSYELKARFCGVHFFNPPRYMHLVELIPTDTTQPQILDQLETFLTSVVGKGVVRAKSATFRTADVVGLDTMAQVIKTMQDNLPDDPFFPLYETPAVLAGLVKNGALGQKSGAGFYKKEGKAIKVLDPKTGTYVDGGSKADELVGRILKRLAAERLKLLRESQHCQAQFLWSIFRDVFHYIGVHLESVADNARDIDLVIRWGFGWNEGPFESWQAAGWTQVAKWVQEDIDAGKALSTAPLPSWVFDGPVAEKGGVHTAEGSWSPASKRFVPRSSLDVYKKLVFRAPLAGEAGTDPKIYGKTLFETDAVRAWVDDRAGEDDVVIVSFKSKMKVIGPSVLDGLTQAIELAEADYKGVVIWQTSALKLGNPGGAFSAGANLEESMLAFMMGGAKGMEPFVRKFQQAMLRVKYASVPVVAAVSGIALSGGGELALHSAKRVAHIESYLGLVEVGIGLVPAGGGLKEAALRAATAASAVNATSDLLKFLQKSFENAAMAKVSASALEARSMGYLKASDMIVFNVHELLDIAKKEARALSAAGYRAPLRASQIPVAGRSAISTIKALLVNMRDGRFISDHDFLIASRIAEVVCGGDVEAGSLVDEEWLLALERRAFINLLGTAKTQERIMGMLQTGKPVRN
ncbi:MAG: 3-hydroxyacyl-CoA dehydrogenase [fadN-fadA-fadE operon] (EC / Enoyl-CoA hydratase [fadN-fadA-fadE operon] (EC [uncultured Caballeronia sp.]|nr:MAG: 3-hydroxyacyl-CoA dehydrogenase [fadN-fadA-fadE operon] (EC / Enoyl-CoA hydratase [fadN-fadA-fadE operon] (EC [uncultured Caballeronia sp.]